MVRATVAPWLARAMAHVGRLAAPGSWATSVRAGYRAHPGPRWWRSYRARPATAHVPRRTAAGARRAAVSLAECPRRPRTSQACGKNVPVAHADAARSSARRHRGHRHAPRRDPARALPHTYRVLRSLFQTGTRREF